MRSTTRTICSLAAICAALTMFTGCAGEQQLQSSIQTVFDTAALPARIVVRQIDNIFDWAGKPHEQDDTEVVRVSQQASPDLSASDAVAVESTSN